MKSDRPYPFVTIDARGAKRAQQGHPWVFDNEITAQEGALEDGALCDVRSPKGRYLGTGTYNSHSKIRVRLLSQNANDKFDQAFFARRAQYAWDYRKTVMGPDADSCRVIFGEADRFPGLTVDKFGDILVTQTLCLGTELRKDWIFPALVQAIEAGGEHIRGIYERNDVKIRELEGMEQNKGWYPLEGKPLPESTQTEIVENGIRYLVDFENGQKTGFFLDQKYNRAAAARIAPGRAVLDCFTHTGSFGLNCAKAGAKRVHSVDVSETAIACAKENAARNGLSVEYEVANVFDLLPNLIPGEYDYHEGPAPGRVLGHLFLLPLYDGRPVPEDAPKRRQRRPGGAASGGSPRPGPGPPRPMECPGNRLSEVLHLPSSLAQCLRSQVANGALRRRGLLRDANWKARAQA